MGPVAPTAGTTLTTTGATLRTLLAVLHVGWCMPGAAVVALLLSTVTDDPLAAAPDAVAVLAASRSS